MCSLFNAGALPRASFKIHLACFPQSLIETLHPSARFETGEGAYNNSILGYPSSIVYAQPSKWPVLCTVLTPGPNAHLANLWCLLPPSCFTTVTLDNSYPIPAAVRFLSRKCGSRSLHIGKYVIMVLEVLHNKPVNSRQHFHFGFSIRTHCPFTSHIIDEYFCNWTHLCVVTFSRYSDICWYQIGSSLYQSGRPVHALHILEGHIVLAILTLHVLVVPRVKVNQWRNGQSSEGFGKLFDVMWYPAIIQCMPICAHGIHDEAILLILRWNKEVSIPLRAINCLE